MIFLASLLLLAAAGQEAPPAAPADGSKGVWRNPSGSVRIEVIRCGEAMCGKVVWANDKAKADSARGGTKTLVGTTILRDFKRDAKGVWYGKAFAPDINKTFSGSATRIDASRVKVTGCLLGRIGCKSQIWTRVG